MRQNSTKKYKPVRQLSSCFNDLFINDAHWWNEPHLATNAAHTAALLCVHEYIIEAALYGALLAAYSY